MASGCGLSVFLCLFDMKSKFVNIGNQHNSQIHTPKSLSKNPNDWNAEHHHAFILINIFKMFRYLHMHLKRIEIEWCTNTRKYIHLKYNIVQKLNIYKIHTFLSSFVVHFYPVSCYTFTFHSLLSLHILHVTNNIYLYKSNTPAHLLISFSNTKHWENYIIIIIIITVKIYGSCVYIESFTHSQCRTEQSDSVHHLQAHHQRKKPKWIKKCGLCFV